MTVATETMPTDGEEFSRSKQLNRLMVQWRMRLRPQQIPALVRRKGHVTQEEMSLLCGLTHSYYGGLERGRVDRGYSDSTLDTVARALRLTAGERVALYLLATGREPRPRAAPPSRITTSFTAELECQPWPAYLVNATWDVLACNSAFVRWFPDEDWHINTMRALFCLPESRRQLVDWETVHVPRAIAQLRARFTRLPNHHGLKQLISDVLEASSEARHLWRNDPTVWMHEDGDRRALYLPGMADETKVEVQSVIPGRNLDLLVTSLVPFAGYIPIECRPFVSRGDGHDESM